MNLMKRVCAHVSCFVCTQISTPEDTEIYTFGPCRALSDAEFSTIVSQAAVQEIGSCALSISVRAEALLDFIFIYILSLFVLLDMWKCQMPSKVMLYLPDELILTASCHIKKDMQRKNVAHAKHLHLRMRGIKESGEHFPLLYPPLTSVVQKKLHVAISPFRAQQSSGDQTSFDSFLSA